jgi:hypothetical protein
MTKIICRANECIYWEEGVCASEQITYDPEQGCLTFEGIEDVLLEDEEEWDEDDILDDEEIDWNADDDELLDLDEDDIDEDWDV